MTDCGNCARPVADGYDLCTRCATALAEQLLSVPGLLDDLMVSLARQDRLTGSGGRGGAEVALPVRLDIPDAVNELGTELTTWARLLYDEHPADTG
ncbi:MAG: hypothetical protein ACRDRL_27645, partial [Sciscionella sp.]